MSGESSDSVGEGAESSGPENGRPEDSEPGSDSPESDVAPDDGSGAMRASDAEQTAGSRDPLTVEELHVRRAPGFDAEELHLEALSPDVTVVHGPNASGKTTAARAVQWALWPDAAPDRAEIVGRFGLDDSEWRVLVDHGHASYQRDGQAASAPGLPSADQRDRYRLALHDLLQHDVRDADFAAAIERESAGGYDLDAAHDGLDFDDSPVTRGKQEVKRAESAIGEWREAREELRDLESEQDRLPELERELEAAREAKQRVDLLDQAIDYARAKEDLQDAEAALESFPDELDALDGDELERVERLESEIDEWEGRLSTAESDHREAEQELQAVALPEGGLPDGLLEELQHRLDELDRLEDRERQLERDLAATEKRRADARSDVPLDIDEQRLETLDPAVWPSLWEFARAADDVEHERRLRQTVDSWLGTEDRGETDASTLQRGQQALEAWLANPPTEEVSGSDAASQVAAVAAAVVAVLVLLLGILVNWLLLALLVLSVALLWYGRHASGGDAEDDRRGTYREDFRQLDLDPVPAWTEPAVRERLTDLYDALADHELEQRQASKRETLLEDARELARLERELDERRTQLRDEIGATPEDTDLELVATAKALLRWEEEHEEVQGVRERLETVGEQIDELLDDVAADLAPFGDADVDDADEADVDDAATAARDVRDLEDRAARHEDAVGQRDRAEDRIDEADGKLESLGERVDGIFSDAGLDPGEYDRLRELCEQVAAYEEAVTERDRASTVVERERSELRTMPQYRSELEEQTVAELRAAKQAAEATAEEFETLHQQATEIETKIADAKRDAQVETARADAERALDALEGRLADDAAAMVGDVLVEHVREATVDAGRPAVFERGRDLLARFTRGRYRLDLEADGGGFRAYDTAKDRGFALDDLSSGTQVQVLLAVRLAFVDHQEQGRQLPLLLDETLANSDDETARAIVDATTELVRAGRQVLYFTAQGDEVAKWRTALADADDVEYAEVDLATQRDVDSAVRVPDADADVWQPTSPPEPDGHDHSSYGDALDVPSFDPRLGAGRAHCWYLLEDVELLSQLLEVDVERWGQLETLIDRGLGRALLDDAERLPTLQRRGRALETFVECWQRGRGDPVDRDALEATDAVTDTFIDDVTELARSVDGDARRILDGLRNNEVDRFRSNKIDELESYFEANGHLDPLDPMAPDEIRRRVIATFVDEGLDRDAAVEAADALRGRLDRRGSD